MKTTQIKHTGTNEAGRYITNSYCHIKRHELLFLLLDSLSPHSHREKQPHLCHGGADNNILWKLVLADAGKQRHNFLLIQVSVSQQQPQLMQSNHTREACEREQRTGGGPEGGRAVQQPHTVCKAVFVILASTLLEVRGDALQTDYNPIRGTEELFSHWIHQTSICCSNKIFSPQ